MLAEQNPLSDSEVDTSLNTLQHPSWIKEKLTHPYEEMTMVVCKDLVPLSITRLVDNIGLPFDYNNPNVGMFGISYFTKAGCPQIAEYCQPGVDLVVSAGNVVETIKRFPDRQFRLFVGRPNEVDTQYGFIQVITPEELTDISQQLTPAQCEQINEILFDGNITENGGYGNFQEYFQAMRVHPLIQGRKVSFRVNTRINRNNIRHGQTAQLDITTASQMQQSLPLNERGGFNVYAGNPFTSEFAHALTEKLDLPDLDTTLEPGYTPRMKVGPGDEDYVAFPEKIYLGGFGGYGDEIPYEAIRNFILRVKKANNSTKVILELGTKLVEDSCVLVTPEKPEEVLLSDVESGGCDMIYEVLKDIGTIILRPVSYAYWQQRGLPVDVV